MPHFFYVIRAEKNNKNVSLIRQKKANDMWGRQNLRCGGPAKFADPPRVLDFAGGGGARTKNFQIVL